MPSIPPARPPRGAGWYRGDLHTHTVHSDGSQDIAGLLTYARANQLDFITLSDHNTVSGLPEFEAACPTDLLPICGTELTTFWGHALALGRREWVDWRIVPGRREMADIYAEVEAQGGLFIIAHPESLSDPYCTGCGWSYSEMRPGPARVVEVWNSPWASSSNNELGLALVCQWLNQGLRLVLTAGSDRHGNPQAAPEEGFNVVYAAELSEAAILAAVRAGHLYLSSGPTLAFSAQAAGQQLMPGDSCLVNPGEPIQLTASWRDCPPDAQVELLVDGEPHPAPAKALSAEVAAWQLPGGRTSWALLVIRAEDSNVLALTNPIYFDGRS